MNVAIHPEIIKHCFQNGIVDEYCAWLLLKAQDNETQGSGIATLNEAKIQIGNAFSLSNSSAYRLLSSGIDLFWKKTDDKIYLLSSASMCMSFGVSKLLRESLSLPLSCFKGTTTQNRRAILFSALAGSSPSPQSYEALARQCHISRRTAVSYIKMSPVVQKVVNYIYGLSFATLGEMNKHLAENELHSNDHIVQDGSGWHLLHQIGNSYRTSLWKVKTKKKINKQLRSKGIFPAPGRKPPQKRVYSYTGLADSKFHFKGISEVSSYIGDWEARARKRKVAIWGKNENRLHRL